MGLSRLDEKHYRCIELMLEGWTNKKISEELDVHYNTITNWSKDALFQNEFKKTLQTSTYPRLKKLIDSMLNNATDEGNAAMAKLVLQMNGMLTDKLEVTQNENKNEVDIDEIKKRAKELRRGNSQ